MGWDGMVIIGHRSSNGTFGAYKCDCDCECSPIWDCLLLPWSLLYSILVKPHLTHLFMLYSREEIWFRHHYPRKHILIQKSNTSSWYCYTFFISSLPLFGDQWYQIQHCRGKRRLCGLSRMIQARWTFFVFLFSRIVQVRLAFLFVSSSYFRE